MNELAVLAVEYPSRANDVLLHVRQIEHHLDRVKAGLIQEEQSAGSMQVTAARIRRLIAARRLRHSFFSGNLFSDPAWDILLEAFAAELDQQRISVSGLCDASGVPSSTALRWLRALENDGWLVRQSEPLDGRRYWVELSSRGVEAMQRYWTAAGTGGLLL